MNELSNHYVKEAAQKDNIFYESICINVPNRRICKDRKWTSACQGLWRDGIRMTANEYEISFWNDENFPILDSGDKCVSQSTESYT